MPEQNPPNLPAYYPKIFEAATVEKAKEIILGSVDGATSQERWEKETPYLVEEIGKHLKVGPETCLLDYGCGIGRVSKGLIERFGCRMVGVDFSQAMRLYAPDYVLSERFVIWSPETLSKMIANGFRADGAIAIWVIQHVLEPQEVLKIIAQSLRPGGYFFALNEQMRSVPTDRGWMSDGRDVRAELTAVFQEEHAYSLPEAVTTVQLAKDSMIQVLRKRDMG